MKSSSSDPGSSRRLPLVTDTRRYFCDEPWTGLFSIETNLDVTFCPCYLKMRIGNLNDASLQEIWNAEALVHLRESFERGELPPPCRGQLCPVALGHGT